MGPQVRGKNKEWEARQQGRSSPFFSVIGQLKNLIKQLMLYWSKGMFLSRHGMYTTASHTIQTYNV
jgi:hypothetical protein